MAGRACRAQSNRRDAAGGNRRLTASLRALARGAPLRLLVLALAAACAPGMPRIDGVPGAPVSRDSLWPTPPAARTPAPPPGAPPAPAATAALRADSLGIAGERTLSMTDVVGLALANNPATRQSWALARAAADVYGVARGELYPTIDGNLTLSASSGGRGGAVLSPGVSGGTGTGTSGSGTGRATGASAAVTQVTPSASLSYLVFDVGGRAGSIQAARQRAVAADLSHNATVSDVVLQVESSLFSYLADLALRDAQQVAVREAEADLAAARERYRVGVAAIVDVLQTQTALTQARLQLETLEGALMSARGTLALAMGFPANARFDVARVAGCDSVATVAESVDALVSRAIGSRPEVAQVRAQAAALAADVRVARSAGYPALVLNSAASSVHSTLAAPVNSFGISLGLQIPVFSGFAQQYDVRSAREQYEAGLASVTSEVQQVTLEVFTSYYALQAATRRVHTAAELLGYAGQSATVAAGRYRAGVGTIVDVILARSALATARAEDIQARWEWRTALAQLAHDTGTLDLRGEPGLPLTPDSTGGR